MRSPKVGDQLGKEEEEGRKGGREKKGFDFLLLFPSRKRVRNNKNSERILNGDNGLCGSLVVQMDLRDVVKASFEAHKPQYGKRG